MPSVTLNRKEVEKLVGKKFTTEELKDRIIMLGTDLEEITKTDIEVEIFPDRPDLLSEQGFARALASFTRAKPGLREYKVSKSNYEVNVDKSVKGIRDKTVCAVIKGLTLDDEKIKQLMQIQEKLHVTFGRNRKKAAIGIYPLDKIKFPITYTAKKPQEIIFRPLEFPTSCDAHKILESHTAGKKFAKLLEGLDKYPIFIDANNEILSMPPIINSHTVGKVETTTQDVFIECSGFDVEHLSYALNMIVTAFSDMGGDIVSVQVKYPDQTITTPNLTPMEMKFDYTYSNKILGLNLSEKETAECLESMGFSYNKGVVKVPAYRSDILHPIDLVEDVAIGYGFENFTPQIPDVATIGKESELEIFKEKLTSLLVGQGFLEAMNYHLILKEKQSEYMRIKLNPIRPQSPVSLDYNTLREWILPSLMDTLNTNKMHELPHKMFEMGTAFKKDTKEEANIKEYQHIAAVIAAHNADWTMIRQILDNISSNLNIKLSYTETDHPSLIDGRRATVHCNTKEIGFIGEIHPEVLTNFGLDVPVCAFELDLELLQKEIKHD